jgi:thiol-disulfide isomerase/thioredoxin
MKRFYAIVLVALVVGVPAARAQGIKLFEGTWSQVLAEAQRTGKPIYLDAYASWCGPCKMLKKDVFPREDVGAYFNANYISYSMDMEKGEGIELAKKYNVRAYPTHLYFDANGEIVHRAIGGGSGDEIAASFIQWAKEARDPSMQLYTLKRGFDKGERNPEALYRLTMGAADAGLPGAEYFAHEYFRTQSDADLLSEKNFKAIETLANDFSHPAYAVLMQNRVEIAKRYGQAKVEAIMLRVASSKLREAEGLKTYGERLFGKADSTFRAATSPEDVRALGRMIVDYHQTKGDWAAYAASAARYIDLGKIDNPGELNEIAWAFYEHVDDKAMLAKAESWAKLAFEKEPNYAIADTYAAVLFKLGRKSEAKTAAQKAIDLGKKEGTDVAGTEELLTKIDGLSAK